MRRFLFLTVMAVGRLSAGLGRLWGAEPADRPLNVPMPTLGGKQFWADEFFFHQWRIQHNVLTGHYRLLDENDYRQAWGTFDDCRAVLERIKVARRLPPMRGKAVILLHGLFRSHDAMTKFGKYLQEQGGYVVFSITYPSTQSGAAEHAQSLARIVAGLEGIEEINFVAHSMGNIVVRQYLADLKRPDPRFRRMVMLAPPNHGSLAAVVAAENVIFKTLTGEAGQELGAQWSLLEKRLAVPSIEFGIIAGGKQDGRGFNPLLPGDNDGVIGVDTTRLAGAADFAVLPALHTFIMNDAKVQEYTLRFLQHGHFLSAKQRRPLAATAPSPQGGSATATPTSPQLPP